MARTRTEIVEGAGITGPPGSQYRPCGREEQRQQLLSQPEAQ